MNAMVGVEQTEDPRERMKVRRGREVYETENSPNVHFDFAAKLSGKNGKPVLANRLEAQGEPLAWLGFPFARQPLPFSRPSA